jgi:hypothetical protein
MRSRFLLATAVLFVLTASHSSAAVDLRVAPENLVVRPAGPYEQNQSIVIDVASRNVGNQAAEALLRLECIETGQILLEQRLRFPGGGFNTGQKGWIVPRTGMLTLRLSVNPDRAVVETDYGNNVVEKRITVQGPEPPPPPPLEISRVNILPAQPSAGQPLLIQAEVRNPSRQEQLFGVFVFYRRPAATDDSVATFSQHQRLAAGRQRVIDMRWTPPSFSPIPIRIEVQQEGKAVTSVSRRLTLEMPDLAIRGFDMVPKMPSEATEPRLEVTIGSTASSTIKVWLVVREVGRAEIGRQLVTLPAQGQVVARLGLPRRSAGRYELALELNSGLAGATPVSESNLDNNRARMFWVVQAASDGEFGRVIVADARDHEIWSQCRARRGEQACRALHPAEDVQVEEPLAFEIEVWNRGSGRARFPGVVRLRAEGSRDSGTAVARFDSGVLDPGRSDVTVARWTPRRTGRYELIFDLDPENSVAESNEGNNRLVRPLRVHHRIETGVLYIGQRQEVAFPPARYSKQSWRNNNRIDTRGSGVVFKVEESANSGQRRPNVSWLGGVAYTTFEVREGELGERRGRADLEINMAALGFMEHVDPRVPLVDLAIGASTFEVDAKVQLYHSPGDGSLSRQSVILAEKPLFRASVDRDWAEEFIWTALDFKGIKSKFDALSELVMVDQVVPWRGYVILPGVSLEAGRRYNVAVKFRAECRANGVGSRSEVNFMDRDKAGDDEGRQLYPDDARGIFFNHMEAVWKSTQ